MDPTGLVDQLRQAGLTRGALLAIAVDPAVGCALATGTGWSVAFPAFGVARVIADIEQEHGPRWVMWTGAPASQLVAIGVRVARCWDVDAVQRLLVGGWRVDPPRTWAELRGLSIERLPEVVAVDLFTQHIVDDAPDEPLRPDGYLKSDWATPDFSWSPARLECWARLAIEVATMQQARLAALDVGSDAIATARSESAAELLCAELGHDGLPMDRQIAEQIIAGYVGPRPATEAAEVEQRRARDAEVLRHAAGPKLRPAQSGAGQVAAAPHRRRAARHPGLAAGGDARESHPLISALLEWRKAERVATTFGYAWLDEHLGEDGRLRGEWSGSDGAAGRMTATAGLHNMPAHMRPAVTAEPGHVFVRADLGQIEPRVLAAVSGDAALARATAGDDLYPPVAERLGVDRATAKVAVLGAMYGQTTGHGATALRGLEQAYPVAMRYLLDADLAGQVGRDVRTYGGRLVRIGSTAPGRRVSALGRSRAAAQGRYGRNAMVQGAAAELFKVWAATVGSQLAPHEARVVMCLHDELLVHAPAEHGEAVAAVLLECLSDAAGRWAPDGSVRFVADISVIRSWAEAK